MYYRMTEFGVTKEWAFEEDTTFEQCRFIIYEGAEFVFKNVKKVSFIHCEFFDGSKDKFFIQTDADVVFDRCTFTDCRKLCKCENNSVVADYCEFKNSTDVLNCMNANIAVVKNSRFNNSPNAVCGVKLHCCSFYK